MHYRNDHFDNKSLKILDFALKMSEIDEDELCIDVAQEMFNMEIKTKVIRAVDIERSLDRGGYINWCAARRTS
jgi:hypothetical protein